MVSTSSSAWPKLGSLVGSGRNRGAAEAAVADGTASKSIANGSISSTEFPVATLEHSASSHPKNLATSTSSGAPVSCNGSAVELPPVSVGDQKQLAVVSSTTEPATIPRRNLTETFEELYVAPSAPAPNVAGKAFPTCTTALTPGLKSTDDDSIAHNLISPTGVAELYPSVPTPGVSGTAASTGETAASVALSSDTSGDADTPLTLTPQKPSTYAETKVDHSGSSKDHDDLTLPSFNLHPDLQRDLSQAVINRVSFYGVLHDINKEATAMAANDELSNLGPCELEDESPLVVAVNGPPATGTTTHTDGNQLDPSLAVIDEERWLLAAIETRGHDENRPIQACPPTFLQAMGERDYELTQENPLTSLSNGSRTQLWKPSRSWWEAKSGKNPWIEPKSHNKRWRYLWPLIHYHKFLAKCIKKLKRNNVDVKLSVSPVAVFLREEVCAISDHLAAVSLFDSDEWMTCLQKFQGWTDTENELAQANLRGLVARLPLRSLLEPGDVDSPLLRSQIDEHFLRAMVAARSHLEIGAAAEPQDRRKPKFTRSVNQPPRHDAGSGGIGAMVAQAASHSCPPMYPRQNSASPYQVPNQVGDRSRGTRRPRMGYPYPQQWYGWAGPHHYHFPDDASAHSSLSGDAYSDYGIYTGAPPMHNGQYYPPMFHPHGEHVPQAGTYSMTDPQHPHHTMYPMYDPYHPENGWMGHPGMDPSMSYGMHHQGDMNGYYSMPSPPTSPQDATATQHQQETIDENQDETVETPYKQTPLSPFWAHLDRATLAMGLATPQTNPAKSPMRNEETETATGDAGGDVVQADASGTGNVQPLLLRQSQFYGYGGYAPPSPATQFMMSPQASFAYNYGYGYSPSDGSQGHGAHHTSPSSFSNAYGFPRDKRMSSSLKHATPGRSPPARAAAKGKFSEVATTRESPATTVASIITESDSQS